MSRSLSCFRSFQTKSCHWINTLNGMRTMFTTRKYYVFRSLLQHWVNKYMRSLVYVFYLEFTTKATLYNNNSWCILFVLLFDAFSSCDLEQNILLLDLLYSYLYSIRCDYTTAVPILPHHASAATTTRRNFRFWQWKTLNILNENQVYYKIHWIRLTKSSLKTKIMQ